MQVSDKIKIEDYNYPLPDSRIAKFPLQKRDESKLLVFKNGEISQAVFKDVAEYLPKKSILVYNETKVIQARLNFVKATGAGIEIFCLEPVEPSNDFQLAFQQKNKISWKCFVGNSKRWKSGLLSKAILLGENKTVLFAKRIKILDEASLITFEWEGDFTFGELLENIGQTPIPPYLNRKAELSDKENYQTVYAQHKGSVAAPTAGLHFTPAVFAKLQQKKIPNAKLTLHVGAGTFKPVVADNISDHVMHFEQIIISKNTIQTLHDFLPGNIVAVGTTSVRSLESLYWFGLKLIKGKVESKEIFVEQWDPYQYETENLPGAKTVLSTILAMMEEKNLEYISGSTQLMILPGYNYQLVRGMLTNFHQPKSTLLLLVSAFIGKKWEEVYKYALDQDFRFLSYGDSCLFLPERNE
jgi:S-adenosylmethionine:tRNA ribosyltransferase-isomerase